MHQAKSRRIVLDMNSFEYLTDHERAYEHTNKVSHMSFRGARDEESKT